MMIVRNPTDHTVIQFITSNIKNENKLAQRQTDGSKGPKKHVNINYFTGGASAPPGPGLLRKTGGRLPSPRTPPAQGPNWSSKNHEILRKSRLLDDLGGSSAFGGHRFRFQKNSRCLGANRQHASNKGKVYNYVFLKYWRY